MLSVISRNWKGLSILVVIFGVLYKYEIPQDSSSPLQTTLLVAKTATIHQSRSRVYRVIAAVKDYSSWYPNVARVEHVQLVKSHVHNGEGQRYKLFTKMPIIGEISSTLVVETDERLRKFVFSVDSWLLEKNIVELKDNEEKVNSTLIEWSVHTKRRSILFQYLILPFAKFYKNQLLRETLFTLLMQSREF